MANAQLRGSSQGSVPVGQNADVAHVIAFTKLTGEFSVIPVAGFKNCESLIKTCMIDFAQPMSPEQRLQSFDVQYSPPVRSDTMLFLRVHRGKWSAISISN